MIPTLPPAIVLTAGLGTRLAPLSDVRAKPAVPVAGVPLVLRILRWLARQAVPAVVLNLHHKPETITRVVGHGADAGIQVRYSWEPTILGSAGGPRLALSLLGPRFFIINGDTLTDLDLSELYRAHESTQSEVTLAVTDHPAPTRYGGVVVDETGRAVQFCAPGTPSKHFIGVQLAESTVFQPLVEGQPAATIGGLYDTILSNGSGRIATHHVGASFYDVGTPADYLATSLAIARAEGHDLLPLGDRARVHPEAVLTRTVVWDDVSIAEGCHLTDCIVTDNARLPPHTVCARTTIVQSGDGPSFTPFEAGIHG